MIEFMLDEFANGLDTKSAVDLVSFQDGRGTETGKAIRFMADTIERGFGKRNDSKVVAMVITDGRSSEKKEFVYQSAERLKEVVDIVIAVGVNMKKEVTYTLLIKSDSKNGRALSYDSYDLLFISPRSIQ